MNYFRSRSAAATRIQAVFRRTRVPRWKVTRRERWGRRPVSVCVFISSVVSDCVPVCADARLKEKLLDEARVADKGRRHRLKRAKKDRELDSASSDCASQRRG